MNEYPKRLIEVDLPIKRISAHARREKDMRRGHIPLLHIWWATRPPAACRAVICASLWFDPADDKCPESFRETARELMQNWGSEQRILMSGESFDAFEKANKDTNLYSDSVYLRGLLLDFIADFANWDNSTSMPYLETSRALTDAAHIANGGEPGTKPLVVDPFAGGGAIPLEGLRVGADSFASDLNPVAVLLNKVVLEYVPQYGHQLADEVGRRIAWVKSEAEKLLSSFYPNDPNGSTPIAYMWARTVTCEGPGCGVEVPMIRSLLLAKRKNRSVAVKFVPNRESKRIDLEILDNVNANGNWTGSLKRGAVTCPYCGYTTPVASVRKQLISRQGGTKDARLYAVAVTSPTQRGRSYRPPTRDEIEAVNRAASEIARISANDHGSLSQVPDEQISLNEIRRINPPIYGMTTWGDLYTPRQALAISTLVKIVSGLSDGSNNENDPKFMVAVQTCLALMVDKMADMNCSLCVWQSHAEIPAHMFSRQAIPMVWDFAETNPLAGSSGSPESSGKRMVEGLIQLANGRYKEGQINQATATGLLLPDDSAQALITDPPYYDAVPYAYLSDFFYVLLRRSLSQIHPDLFREPQVPKVAEIVVDRPHELSQSNKDVVFYEDQLGKAFSEGRRVVRPDGICTIVFASKTTASWEAVLRAVVDAGWIITGSWPIDTEMQSRVSAQGQARLASSVHLVCRPREDSKGSPITQIGDWRDVLRELPVRIHEWMPRLASEGVVGADAIFACIGPALEIFSRYSSVEKPSGEIVTLREYLEHVWAAVAKEALEMIFSGADTAGFEEDSRLTAMWLWTLFSGATTTESPEDTEEESDSDEESSGGSKKVSGYVLEYDAARKIAQGLGAHLEDLDSIIEIKGDKARLLSVSERARELFGFDSSGAVESKKKKKSKAQAKLFTEMEDDEYESAFGIGGAPKTGETTLDRVHQTMLLFGAARSEAVKRFLVDDGVGNDERFWRLADNLSKLYPSGSQEKRWVDGVLARKKGLGF